MTWLKKENACTLDATALNRLLEYHQRAEWEALKLYGHHKNVMLVLITAIFAGSVAILTTSTNAFLWIALFIPAAVSTMCFFTRRSLDRYYQRFLEAIVGSAKVEYMLGLEFHAWPNEIPPGFSKQIEDGKYPFSDDSTIDVDRRWHSRLKAKDSMCWIVQCMSGGHNRVIERLLQTLFFFSFFVPIAALLRVANLQPTSCAGQLWHTFCANWLFATLVVLSLLFSVCLHLLQCRWITRNRRNDQRPLQEEEPNR